MKNLTKKEIDQYCRTVIASSKKRDRLVLQNHHKMLQ